MHILHSMAAALAADPKADQGSRWAAFVLLLLGAGLLEFFLKEKHGESLPFIISTTIMGMGAFGVGLIALNWAPTKSFGTWLIGVTHLPQGSPIAGMVLVVLAILFRRFNIPYIPETVERALIGVFYFLGGFVMLGSTEWANFLTQAGSPVLDVVTTAKDTLLLALAGVNLFLTAIGQPTITIG